MFERWLIYFLHQRELETHGLRLSVWMVTASPNPTPQHHYCLPGDPLASYLPTSPSFLHLLPTVVLVCGYHPMMGQCGANPICWTHPNYSLVVTGREPNDSGYCGMLFCAIINFLWAFGQVHTSQTSWGSVRLLTEIWTIGRTHPSQLWASPFSGKESFQRGSEGAWSKEALLSPPWEECATPVCVDASIPMATTSLPCYFWRARACGSIILRKKKMMLSPPSLEISQVSTSSSMKFLIT